MDETQSPLPVKGRGAVSNHTGRFEPQERQAADDGWDLDDPDVAPLRTQVTFETPRTIIARNTSPDIPFDRSINPYKGCEHGCVLFRAAQPCLYGVVAWAGFRKPTVCQAKCGCIVGTGTLQTVL